MAYDLLNDAILWEQHLDLSVDDDEHGRKAYIYSSPTVVDLDGDRNLEVIVGTSMGFIYVFDATTGTALVKSSKETYFSPGTIAKIKKTTKKINSIGK